MDVCSSIYAPGLFCFSLVSHLCIIRYRSHVAAAVSVSNNHLSECGSVPTIGDVINSLEAVIQRDEGGRGIGQIVVKGELVSAAQTLLKSKNVAIITGFPCLMDFDPPTETDGPLGALAIARCLIALGKNVTIATDECNAEPMLACAAASGLLGNNLSLECFSGGIEFDEGEATRLRELGM